MLGCLARATGKQAIVADAMETTRQNVEQEAARKTTYSLQRVVSEGKAKDVAIGLLATTEPYVGRVA